MGDRNLHTFLQASRFFLEAIATSQLRPLPGGDILAGLGGWLGFQLKGELNLRWTDSWIKEPMDKAHTLEGE